MRVLKVFTVIFILFWSGSLCPSFAQELKFGHLNVQKLIAELPEKINADKELQQEAKKLQDQLEVMTKELDEKYKSYMAQRDSLSDLIRATREKEIQDYDQRIQNFNKLAQQSLSQKEQKLLQPIIEKVQKAINAVGEEQGLIYIFDTGSNVVLYNSPQSIDCEDLVKAKLQEMREAEK
ncbi:OmpH family outer membrane protein [Thermophagus xiamenensis]|jgi:outer membrane protein|uniref:Periplasmic chaperone for outer membrane proteins Skp n=1 Tax=Thermophagus xiamenensis TaxID=385682 RepID=A0A1I1XSD4_9BACT|nr:OmpH family outer membrane protein [Thermophagus xiamenensis]SFE09548.1 periplasmic chaperone for outer membrane proteins Skp [Thermophagus xiamenensis]